jgi:hypothetical protein
MSRFTAVPGMQQQPPRTTTPTATTARPGANPQPRGPGGP